MNRSQDDINVIKKVNMIVQDKLPGFTSRYFRSNMDLKTPRTLYGYATDLTSFFEYLEYRDTDSFDVKLMSISDLNRITPSIIEDYLNYSREYSDKGAKKIRSDVAIKRRYSSLSSFLEYYYQKGMIDQNPANRITPPRQNKQVTLVPSAKTNRDMIDFISNGSLEGRKAVFQAKTCIRDAAIVILIASTGIKVSDLVDLNIDDLHLDDTSDICGIDQETMMMYYRPYIDDYECEKGREFNI